MKLSLVSAEMVATPTKLISLAEFLGQPEIKPAQEYSDGIIRQKPMPKGNIACYKLYSRRGLTKS